MKKSENKNKKKKSENQSNIISISLSALIKTLKDFDPIEREDDNPDGTMSYILLSKDKKIICQRIRKPSIESYSTMNMNVAVREFDIVILPDKERTKRKTSVILQRGSNACVEWASENDRNSWKRQHHTDKEYQEYVLKDPVVPLNELETKAMLSLAQYITAAKARKMDQFATLGTKLFVEFVESLINEKHWIPKLEKEEEDEILKEQEKDREWRMANK